MFEIRYLNERKEHKLGTEYTVLIRDLKTLRGLLNRVENMRHPTDAVFIEVYKYNAEDRYTYDEMESFITIRHLARHCLYAALYGA